MTALRVAPIVEGHGDRPAIEVVLRRTAKWLGAEFCEVLTPIRRPRSKLVRPGPQVQIAEVQRAVQLATGKLSQRTTPRAERLILILLDADQDCAKTIAAQLLSSGQPETALPVCCVLPVVEFETWFIGGAVALGNYLRLDDLSALPDNPETLRLGKGWIQVRMLSGKYSEPLDQPLLAEHFDLDACRQRCPSFDKLCRDLGTLLTTRS